jgi:hypothetical protein
MRTRQSGVSLGGLIIGLFILIFVALLGLRVGPPYMEYFTLKKAITAIAQERGGSGSVSDIRKAFDSRAAIDDFKSIGSQDLEITKEGGEVVISFAYRKEIPLFANIGLYIDFQAASNR